ncbi:MAG: hypothetical protein ACR2PC_09490 [Tsuneonella suprasediminis]
MNDRMSDRAPSRGVSGFAGQFVQDERMGWSMRRRIMAALRASCLVLGIKRRRNRGVGALGYGVPAAGPLAADADLPAYFGSNTMSAMAGRVGVQKFTVALVLGGMLATTAQEARAGSYNVVHTRW